MKLKLPTNILFNFYIKVMWTCLLCCCCSTKENESSKKLVLNFTTKSIEAIGELDLLSYLEHETSWDGIFQIKNVGVLEIIDSQRTSSSLSGFSDFNIIAVSTEYYSIISVASFSSLDKAVEFSLNFAEVCKDNTFKKLLDERVDYLTSGQIMIPVNGDKIRGQVRIAKPITQEKVWVTVEIILPEIFLKKE